MKEDPFYRGSESTAGGVTAGDVESGVQVPIAVGFHFYRRLWSYLICDHSGECYQSSGN